MLKILIRYNANKEAHIEEGITTLHPQRKKGVSISKEKYDFIKQSIINTLQKHGVMTFYGWHDVLSQELTGRFEGSIGWYYTTVKLDLEAVKIIECIPKSKPQQIRLIDQLINRKISNGSE